MTFSFFYWLKQPRSTVPLFPKRSRSQQRQVHWIHRDAQHRHSIPRRLVPSPTPLDTAWRSQWPETSFPTTSQKSHETLIVDAIKTNKGTAQRPVFGSRVRKNIEAARGGCWFWGLGAVVGAFVSSWCQTSVLACRRDNFKSNKKCETGGERDRAEGAWCMCLINLITLSDN